MLRVTEPTPRTLDLVGVRHKTPACQLARRPINCVLSVGDDPRLSRTTPDSTDQRRTGPRSRPPFDAPSSATSKVAVGTLLRSLRDQPVGGIKMCTLLIGSNQAVAAPPGAMILRTPSSTMVTPQVPCLASAPVASSGPVVSVVANRLQDRVRTSKNWEACSVPEMLEAMNSPPKE